MRKELNNIKMIAFDMYGTLVRNDHSSWESLTAEIVRELALPVDASMLHEVWVKHERAFRKHRLDLKTLKLNPPFMSYQEAWSIAWRKTFEECGISAEPIYFAQRGIDSMCMREPFDESSFVLSQLNRKIRVGLLSNADETYLSVSTKKHGWDFELTLSSELAKTYKPDPQIFNLFCKKATLRPHEVLYVGDSLYDDIHGAKNAGMGAMHILRNQDTPGRTPIPEGVDLLAPDAVVTSLEELLQLVL